MDEQSGPAGNPAAEPATGTQVLPAGGAAILPTPETIFFEVEQLADDEQTGRIARLAVQERRTLVALLIHLAEFDRRRLYAGLAYTSLFEYCTQALHLPEHAAYRRMTVARLARRYPTILLRLADGSNHLTAIVRLAPFFTPENHLLLLEKARHRTTREVGRLATSLGAPIGRTSLPRRARMTLLRTDGIPDTSSPPDETSFLLLGPATPGFEKSAASLPPVELPDYECRGEAEPLEGELVTARGAQSSVEVSGPLHSLDDTPGRRPTVSSHISYCRLHVTIAVSTCDKLERARELSRHSIPDGDAGRILDLALTLLVDKLEGQRFGGSGSQSGIVRCRGALKETAPDPSESRHVPIHIRRAVWRRDGGRCTFRAPDGRRCLARSWIEVHHRIPWARGGKSSLNNLELRCREHNLMEAVAEFGGRVPGSRRRKRMRSKRPGSIEHENS